ncbi:Organic hydroperoxide reductase OsmC/OhrA [Reichenbachiella faecimaris]|uniref:Organic hydroperoxide reductase OsmC/OhrA n=1 Tax=Reichenbachiella faecimaris TaxID=692418 RepID=A0A1W2G8U9_REIFA|nr:OsmC family protein [Reichenbachiella faecimaris]SMD33053.1 Organic hydroperoxide reductase OsmC/OhrA [Reichenbachiella faecimaris]
MAKIHNYSSQLTWTGNRGEGTKDYKAYDRSYRIQVDGKPLLEGSSDPAFMGDASKYNPEELFLFSLSSCHMLWYLHLCAVASIVVTDYQDEAIGEMKEEEDGSGAFTEIILKPKVTITDPSKRQLALQLHHKANQMCFIANSCKCAVKHEALIH